MTQFLKYEIMTNKAETKIEEIKMNQHEKVSLRISFSLNQNLFCTFGSLDNRGPKCSAKCIPNFCVNETFFRPRQY